MVIIALKKPSHYLKIYVIIYLEVNIFSKGEVNMGKPFSYELDLIPSTIAFSQSIDSTSIKKYILGHISSSFLIVGSGGSFSVAQVIAMVINNMGGFAQAITPFELMEFSNSIRKVNVLFFSAGGGNPDILSAYSFCKRMEANSTFIFCLTKQSKLVQLAVEKFYDNNYFECNLPSGKDGFLAVNSTILAVALLRQILGCFTPFVSFPSLPYEIDECIHEEAIIALGGRWTLPAVSDFESKCTEAGLISVMPADLRNFAHGRHHWLAKHSATSVICFVSKDEFELAKKTIKILPDYIHTCIVLTEKTGIEATNDMLLFIFQIIQKLGELKEIDPGKPGVPRFGSQIYRLNYRLSVEAEQKGLIEKSVVTRMAKRKHTVNCFTDYRSIEHAAINYLKKLASTYFKALVLDYDNTVILDNCTDDESYHACMNYINSFLQNGIGICFASGRGKSIRKQLLQVIPPDYFDKLYVSYYNGAFTLPLSAELPPVTDSIAPSLLKAREYISMYYPQRTSSETLRNECLTYEGSVTEIESIYRITLSAILHGKLSEIRIARSDHSVDIIPQHISKRNALEFMRNIYGNEILCIGDAGNELGNDFELLDSEYSISSDCVSASLESCWNIASLGLNGPAATREYLGKLSLLKKGLRFSKNYLQVI